MKWKTIICSEFIPIRIRQNDPDLADEDDKKNSKLFCLLLFEATFISFFKDKKS